MENDIYKEYKKILLKTFKFAESNFIFLDESYPHTGLRADILLADYEPMGTYLVPRRKIGRFQDSNFKRLMREKGLLKYVDIQTGPGHRLGVSLTPEGIKRRQEVFDAINFPPLNTIQKIAFENLSHSIDLFNQAFDIKDF